MKITTLIRTNNAGEYYRKPNKMILMKMKIQFYISFSVLLIITTACHRKTHDQLVEYIKNPKSGLCQRKQFGTMQISATFKPSTLLVDQEIRGRNLSKNGIKELFKKYDSYYYFILDLSINNKEISRYYNRNDYIQILDKLTNNSTQNILLVSNRSDTLKLFNYIYAPSYHHSNSTQIMYCFETTSAKTKQLFLKINEVGLFTGNLTFRFKYKDIARCSKYKITNDNQ